MTFPSESERQTANLKLPLQNHLLGPVGKLCISCWGLSKRKSQSGTKGRTCLWGLFHKLFGALPGDHWFETPWITSGYCLQLSGFPVERAIIKYNNQNDRQCGRLPERKYITGVNTLPSDATRVTVQLIRHVLASVLYYCWFSTCWNGFSNSLHKIYYRSHMARF